MSDIDVVILAGGRGTRAAPWTDDRPKGLLPIAGRPLVEHVMRIYAEQGFTSFVVAVGHLGEEIERHLDQLEGWSIRYSRAGADAGTGRRLLEAAKQTSGTFMATYGDGLADVDLQALLTRHREAGRAATVTVTPMRSQYGTVEADDAGIVTRFVEKPVMPGVWINGGFFVFDGAALAGIDGESLEEDILPTLAGTGELAVHRHEGFWRSVDTFKDLDEIERAVNEGRARWAGLKVAGSS